MPPDAPAPQAMVDLHTHLLPGIDDGASNLNVARRMGRQAADDGCAVMIATPHVYHYSWANTDRAQLETLAREVKAALEGVIEVRLGAEIALNSESVEVLYSLVDTRLSDAALPTLAGSRYVLLELDWQGYGPDVFDVVHELVLRGFRPIIAHPERVGWLAAERDLLKGLVGRGAKLQLTAMSVTGALGRRMQRLCTELIEDGLVHFIASDTHDLTSRPPGLSEAYRQVAARHDPELAERIFVHHPRAVLEDRPLEN